MFGFFKKIGEGPLSVVSLWHDPEIMDRVHSNIKCMGQSPERKQNV